MRAVRRWVNWGSGRAAAGTSARVSGRAAAMRRESILEGRERVWGGNWGQRTLCCYLLGGSLRSRCVRLRLTFVMQGGSARRLALAAVTKTALRYFVRSRIHRGFWY